MTPKQIKASKSLLRNYGITLTEYNSRFKAQGHKCDICGKPRLGGKRFDVDHNHKTKFIRGILCPYCNRKLLCYLRDNKQRAEGLVKYLIKALENDKSWE